MLEKITTQKGTKYRCRLMVKRRMFRSPCFDTREEAELWEAKTRVDVDAGKILTRGTKTLATFAQEWLDHQKAATLKGSWQKEHANLTHYILPAFGDHKLRAIDLYSVQRWMNDLKGKISEVKRDDLARCFKQIMGQAEKWGAVSANPLAGLPRIKLMKRRVEVYTHDELTQLLVWLQDNQPGAVDIATWALNTGMRLGEIVALRWSDVDLRTRTATVQTQWDGKELRFAERTKGKRTRQVPLNRECLQILQNLRLATTDHTGVIFKGMDYYHMTRDWTEWMEKAGLQEAVARGCSFHNTRHTFASGFMQAGGNIYDLQAILGHASVTTTERNYLCFDPKHLAGKTDAIGFSVPKQGAEVVTLSKKLSKIG